MCFASNANDLRVADTRQNPQYVNVGERFRRCFELFFFVCLLQLAMLTFMQAFGREYIRRTLSILIVFATYAFYLVWLYLIVIRFSHSGKVCSGDYLSENDSTGGYLIQQGFFIKVVFYFFLYSIALFACCACIAVIYGATRPSS